jgi:hypothetical protein
MIANGNSAGFSMLRLLVGEHQGYSGIERESSPHHADLTRAKRDEMIRRLRAHLQAIRPATGGAA